MGVCQMNTLTTAMYHRTRGRTAVTATEVLMVISIVALLTGLSLPAVQAARESGRRVDCQNRVRQFEIAIANFSDRHAHMPPNGGAPEGRVNRSLYKDKYGVAFVPSTTDLLDFSNHPWGMGDPNESTDRQTG